MTADLFGREQAEDLISVPARKVSGSVIDVLATSRRDDFRTRRTAALTVGLDGIAGDRHAGFVRRSGAREPWYPRGTEICNERQLSILSREELAAIAADMGIDRIEPGWIGGNVMIEGIARLTLVPPRSRLVFSGGVVLRVDGDNTPCRIAGRAIAEQVGARPGLDLLFPKLAHRRRGLVAYVEHPGVIRPDETVTAYIPEHWLYR